MTHTLYELPLYVGSYTIEKYNRKILMCPVVCLPGMTQLPDGCNGSGVLRCIEPVSDLILLGVMRSVKRGKYFSFLVE